MRLTLTLTQEELEALKKALYTAIRDAQSVNEEENLVSVEQMVWTAAQEAEEERCGW